MKAQSNNTQNKKLTVICIYSDDYGFLGVAKNYQSALYYLYNERYIADDVTLYDDNDNLTTLVDYLGHNWFDKQLSWKIEDFNDFWYGNYSLVKCNVYSV